MCVGQLNLTGQLTNVGDVQFGGPAVASSRVGGRVLGTQLFTFSSPASATFPADAANLSVVLAQETSATTFFLPVEGIPIGFQFYFVNATLNAIDIYPANPNYPFTLLSGAAGPLLAFFTAGSKRTQRFCWAGDSWLVLSV
jgi:hypothetical protein